MTGEPAAPGPQLRRVSPFDDLRARLEGEIARVSGVERVRVVGEDAPVEIHVVASGARPPKQLVRDVQSLAAAGFGLTIDHRIVSVVTLEEAPPPEAEARPASRTVLERVVFANKGTEAWVKVALAGPEGESEGAAAAGSSRPTRARAAAIALQRALVPVLEGSGASVELDDITIGQVGSSDVVIVRALYAERGSATELVGAAIIHDDVSTAAVHAFLQALNRKLG